MQAQPKRKLEMLKILIVDSKDKKLYLIELLT